MHLVYIIYYMVNPKPYGTQRTQIYLHADIVLQEELLVYRSSGRQESIQQSDGQTSMSIALVEGECHQDKLNLLKFD